MLHASLGLAPRHILMADDDHEDIELFKEALIELSSDVILTSAGNGAALLDLLTLVTPDIIFLDINMPVMNGVDCLATIRGIPELSEVPVIMYSTASDAHFVSRTFQLGANRYIQKPSSFTVIKSVLTEILRMPTQELLQSEHPGTFYSPMG